MDSARSIDLKVLPSFGGILMRIGMGDSFHCSFARTSSDSISRFFLAVVLIHLTSDTEVWRRESALNRRFNVVIAGATLELLEKKDDRRAVGPSVADHSSTSLRLLCCLCRWAECLIPALMVLLSTSIAIPQVVTDFVAIGVNKSGTLRRDAVLR
jgi:hypothetical protein